MTCPICAEALMEQDHPDYPNPQAGDQWHGQYDPEHPELAYRWEWEDEQ